jgi:hypothetical protein
MLARCARRRLHNAALTSSTRLALVPSYLATTLTLRVYKYCNHWSIEGVQLIVSTIFKSGGVATSRHGSQGHHEPSQPTSQVAHKPTSQLIPSLANEIPRWILTRCAFALSALPRSRRSTPERSDLPNPSSNVDVVRWLALQSPPQRIPIDSESPKLEGWHLDSWPRDGRSSCNHGAGGGSVGA